MRIGVMRDREASTHLRIGVMCDPVASGNLRIGVTHFRCLVCVESIMKASNNCLQGVH
jgi:hypothetical protein